MLFVIAVILVAIGIQLGTSLVWFLAAALVAALAFWQRHQVKEAGIAVLIAGAIFLANGGDLSGFAEHPLVTAVATLALVIYGVMTIAGKGKFSRHGGMGHD